MTVHYHGTPITPESEMLTLEGYHFCVSYARPDQVEIAHKIGAGVILDNGAFSVWTREEQPDWPGFYRFVEPWLRYETTSAVIPDVIDGDEEANDQLIAQWPHGERGAPVWHMHEDIKRLYRLTREWPRVCIGSSNQFSTVGSMRWHERMTYAMNTICGNGPPPCELHMLRGMQMAGSHYPFAIVDSADIARNHNRPQNTAAKMAKRWSRQHCPTEWVCRHVPVGDLFTGVEAQS